MRTKIYKIFFSVIILTIFSLFIVSCTEEDNTGYSTMKPTSPTISITPGFTSPVTLIENGSKYEFTVTLSEAQLVDVHLAVGQIDGTASSADYELTSAIVIPAGSTSGKGSVKILADDVIEGTESLKIQIGDITTANANLTPITVEFSIQNLTSDDLSIGLSWAPSTPTTTNTGVVIPGSGLADMRLLITNSPYSEVIDGADGASYESYAMLGTMPDGEYLVVADIYEALSLVRDLDLSVSFEQLGVIDPYSFEFPAAINTGIVCPYNYFILAKINKAGNKYTIEKVGAVPPLTGAWFGTDTEYPSQVSLNLDCEGSYLISGLLYAWIGDFWGEEIISQENVIVVIDEAAGTVTIPAQPYITTVYKDVEYPYTIEGSGTINTSGEYPVMNITYTVFQDGTDIAQFCFDNKYTTYNVFTATVTLDPAGPKSAFVRSSKPVLVKPVHR